MRLLPLGLLGVVQDWTGLGHRGTYHEYLRYDLVLVIFEFAHCAELGGRLDQSEEVESPFHRLWVPARNHCAIELRLLGLDQPQYET